MPLAPLESADEGCSDAELARKISSGDHKAFEQLMRRFNRPLYRVARSIVKDDAEAEDVVQEAYLQAYRAMKNFHGNARLSTWLTRIVINEAIARSRKSKRRAEIISLSQDGGWRETDNMTMNDARQELPEDGVLRAEARRLLERKIDELPEAFRVVFVLRALEEMTVEETATCLAIPEATVRSRFFRAKGLLREALSREMDFAQEDAFTFDGQRCDRIVASVFDRLQDAAGARK